MLSSRLHCALYAVAFAVAVTAMAPAQALPEVRPENGYWTTDSTADAAPGDAVHIVTRGPVIVRGADREDVGYTLFVRMRGSVDQGIAREKFSQVVLEPREDDAGSLRLRLRVPECRGCRLETRIEVEVPENLPLIEVQTRSGGVNVQGIGGRVGVQNMGGSIALDKIGGAVVATTAGGNIYLGAVAGPVDCRTAGGSIKLIGAQASARLRSSGGEINAQSVGGDLDAETAGGKIKIGRVRGIVRASTGGGSIRVAEALSDIHAASGAGNIHIERVLGALFAESGAGDILASFASSGGLRGSVLETAVGQIVVSMPESVALTVDASVRLARGLQGIVSEFPSVQVERSAAGFGPASEEAAGAINGGGAVLRLRSGVGRIELRKQR